MSTVTVAIAARRLRALVAVLWIAGFCAHSPSARAQQPVYDESRVKAAYLVRFAQFVDWPQDAFQHSGGALVITVAGSEAVYAGLVQLLGQRSGQGRPIVARALKSADDLADTHIFFVGAAAKGRMDQLIASASGHPILIVAESADALERGAMINFLTVDQRVRFEIGVDNAEKAGLTVSSRLLSIAMRIHRGSLSNAPLADATSYLFP